jgi:hypothetical protein
MAVGDVIIEIVVPKQPSGTTESAAQYIEKVKQQVDAFTIANGISPERFEWTNRYDIPEAVASTPSFVEGLLADTSIDLNTYTIVDVPLDDDATGYCYSENLIYCYGTFMLVPRSGPKTNNALIVTVNLDGGQSVDVPVRFVVRWQQPFPG